MKRLFRKAGERDGGLWQRAVDLALTDVRVLSKGVDEDALESLEAQLLAADFGVQATLRLVEHVEGLARRGKVRTHTELVWALRGEVAEILGPGGASPLREAANGPTVYLVVGVNGVGKTTTVAKIAHRLRKEGRSVLMAAADTFRAGAVEQLGVWADRVGATFVKGQKGGDPAAVTFDAIEAALSRSIDAVVVDTAGRLHTNANLMRELAKVDRVIRRKVEGAPHETLMVLDATVGQNASSQMRTFHEAVRPTAIVLAKMDSTARGGIVVALFQEFGVPVKLVGTGEGLDDLEPFHPTAFIEAVFETGGE